MIEFLAILLLSIGGLMFLILLLGMIAYLIKEDIEDFCRGMRWETPWERFKGPK